MQMRQAIAGAIFDFMGRLTSLPEPLTVWAGADASPLLAVFSEWAADRGLNIDEADVRGWQRAMAEVDAPAEKKARHLPPGEELKCQIAEALGYDLDRHDITRMVITLEAGSDKPMLVTVEDMSKPDFEHDVVRTFKTWTLNPTLESELGYPLAIWKPKEGGYKPFDEKGELVR